MSPPERPHLETAARAALQSLVAASGGSVDLSRSGLPADGVVPLEGIDLLRLAAVETDLSLVEVEAGLDEVPEWLERDVPLLTHVASAGDGVGARWLVLTRHDAGTARVLVHDAEGSSTREVPGDALAEELGLDAGRRHRWLRVEDRSATARPTGGSPDAERKLSPLRRLFALLRPDRGDLLAVAVFAVAIGVLLLATPIAVQALVNFVALGGAIPPLIVVVALLFCGLFLAGVLSALQTWVVEVLQRRVFVRTVADLAARLPRLALGEEDRRYGPELVNRFFDVVTIQKSGSFLLLDGLSVLLSVMVGLIVLAFYHPLLLAFDILLLAVIVLIVLGPMRKGVLSAKAESSAKYAVAAWLEELTRNPVLFKSSGVRRTVFERTDALARTWVERRRSHFRVVFGQGLAAIALQVFASTGLLGIGGLLVIQGSLTLGQLVAAELILTLVVSSVAKLGKHLEAFYDLLVATDKLGVLLDLPVERSTGEHHLPGAAREGASLEFADVAWEPGDAVPLFQDVAFAVAPGERIAIRGPSGAGKSTLLRLAWGLLSPSRGAVRIDGRDVRELSLESLRRTASLVDRVELYEGTVRENVDLARPFCSDDDVREALAKVGLLDELVRLPRGMEAELAADGRPLSAGQAARLQVARAIAGRPRLLLVSDFFEGLEETERERLFDALFDPDAPWTLVLVSNARAALDRCDRTLLLEDGALRPDVQDPRTTTSLP